MDCLYRYMSNHMYIQITGQISTEGAKVVPHYQSSNYGFTLLLKHTKDRLKVGHPFRSLSRKNIAILVLVEEEPYHLRQMPLQTPTGGTTVQVGLAGFV
uniref:Uncharacterized protein n=1 Tax=Nelumbo nucifera TaxID=4432 RepID=A0A822YDM9_NELNU|nr:TPA_asm: hypothetical protein HUJ06_029056 [Nelumbo nucifera]